MAPGYKTKERLVSFADNVMMDLSLAPEPAAPSPAPPSRERPAPATAEARAGSRAAGSPGGASGARPGGGAPGGRPLATHRVPRGRRAARQRQGPSAPHRFRRSLLGGPPMRAVTGRGPLLIWLVASCWPRCRSARRRPPRPAAVTWPGRPPDTSSVGSTLYNEGDFRGALAEFRKAHRLLPRASVLYNIGQTEYQVQEYAQALQTLERLPGRDRPGANHRAEVQETVEVLRTRVGWIVFHQRQRRLRRDGRRSARGHHAARRSRCWWRLGGAGRGRLCRSAAGHPRGRGGLGRNRAGESPGVGLHAGARAIAAPFGRWSPEAGQAVGHRSVVTSLAITGALAATHPRRSTPRPSSGRASWSNLRGTYPVSRRSAGRDRRDPTGAWRWPATSWR